MEEKRYCLMSCLQTAILNKFGYKEEMMVKKIKSMDVREMRKQQHKLERTSAQAIYSSETGRIEYVSEWVNDYEPGQMEYCKETIWIEEETNN